MDDDLITSVRALSILARRLERASGSVSLAQYRVLRTSLQEVRRLQRERGEAADAGASDRAAG